MKFIEPTLATVILKEYMPTPEGTMVLAVHGMVSIRTCEDMTGFQPSRGESNWVATVEIGKDRQNSFHIFGCQIRGIVQGPWATGSVYR
jgi:hypothetical protein